MSVFNFEMPFLSISPSIKFENGKIYIKNSILIKILTLGVNRYSIEINTRLQEIKFKRSYFYIFTSSYNLNFKELYYIEYEYSEMPTSFMINFKAADTIETFKIKLIDKKGKKHFIGNFTGEGAVMSGWKGVLLGDAIVDYSGSQEKDSRSFVNVLEKVLKIPVGKPLAWENKYKNY